MADNTASLVVALSAQLTKFEKDMRAAGIMADKAVGDIEDKFSKINPTLSGSFLGSFFGNVFDKALSQITAFVTEAIERFKKLEVIAEQTGLSMGEAFGLQEGAAKFKVSADQINAGLKGLALQVEQMKRGADNTFGQLFTLNPQAFGGVSKQAITLQQALAGVAEIVKHIDDPVAKWDIARSAGLTEEWVRALNQGGPAIAEMLAQADKAGQKFDMLKNKIEALSEVGNMTKEALKSGLGTVWEEILAFWLRDLARLNSALLAFANTFPNLAAKIFDVDKLRAEGETYKELLDKMNREAIPLPRARPTPVPQLAEGAKANLPSLASVDATKNAYERETNAINKQTAEMQAQNATLGESAHAQEEYRVQLILSEKAAQDGKEFTLELNDAIAVTAERAATAKQALAEHTFQMQKLNSASQQVGSALSTAFADAIVDGKSLNDVLSSLIKTLEKAAINALIMQAFTPGPGGALAPILKTMGFAGGTDYAPGGWSVVGERGPELINVPRGSQIIPNDVARKVSAGGGTSVTYQIDASGADGGTVARIQSVLAAHARAITSQGRAMSSAQRLQTTGVA